jgi:hypothetical protein
MQRRRTIPRLSSSNGEAPTAASEPFGRPDFDVPEIPEDITIVSDEFLMQLFSRYVSWQNYAAAELARTEVDESRAEANVRYVEARSMVGNWAGSSDKVTVARAAQTLDPEVEQARQDLLVAYAARKMTAVINANCERTAALISRELSRRIGRDGVERRQMRWAP